ncbi:leucine-rich repeat-containing protein (LRR) [Tieghemostelium lacteum]|uniref:Leucine-rich repeat-containing protein (LRR) n=1 Tax=Tieghemostelium lacteum TaxID=361077 RepID=A0A151Z8U6_TIELA|nr:leucine-rich repeat-containing protein (LRR) [Tieghemostelium lacteum]|eukprot:KYQ90368.1 leucine-rich repeat-containing protein (LRR) [Tieghemostelium lacteum]
MGHPLELSVIENNYIEEWINQYYSQFSEKVIFKSHILSHKKGGSLESKWASSILIITDYHMLLFHEGKELTKKPPKDHHIYDCKKISNKVDYVVSFTFQKGKQKSKVILKADQMNYIVSLVRRLRLPLDSEHCKTDLIINLKFSNKQIITKKEETIFEEYVSLYKGWCSYFNSEPSPIIYNYIQRLIIQNNTEINLNEIQLSEGSEMVLDFIPFFNSLRHNEYFNSLIVKDLKKESQVKAFSDLLLHNSQLKKLIIKRSGNDSLQNIFLSLSLNKKNSIQILDISEQILSTRSISSLVNCLTTFNHSLIYLNLSNCGIPPKSMTMLFEALEKNYGMSLTLEYLNISYNKLDEQANNAFISWIVKSRLMLHLKTLILDSVGITSTTLQNLKFLPKLEHLDLSHNKFDISDLERFFYILSIETLYRIDCNYCNLPKELVAVIFHKMSFKKLNVHLELAGLVIGDDWDMVYVNLLIFKDTPISIGTLRMENSKCTERSIIHLLNTLADIKIQQLTLDNISISGSALTSHGDKLSESQISFIKKSNNPDLDSDSNSSSSGSSSTGGNNSASSPTSSNSTPTGIGSVQPSSHNNSPNNSNNSLKSLLNPLQPIISTLGGGNGLLMSAEHDYTLDIKQFQNSFLKALSRIYFNPELKSLCIANIGRLLKSFLPTLSKPSSVVYLDISGNSLADQGAILLGQALSQNRSILSLNFDSNQITNVGWANINSSISLDTGFHNNIYNSSTMVTPTLPSTPSPSNLYSIVYPSDDIDRLLNATTSDPEERFNINQTLSKLQMTLHTNSLHYSREYNKLQYPVGFQYRKHDLYRHHVPLTPMILYPITPMPKEIQLKLAEKVSFSLEPVNQSTISSIHLFLRDPSTRMTSNPKFRNRLNTLVQYTNNHSLPSRNSPIPFILSIPDEQSSYLNLAITVDPHQHLPESNEKNHILTPRSSFSSSSNSNSAGNSFSSLPPLHTSTTVNTSISETPKSLIDSCNTQSSIDEQEVLEEIQCLESAIDYCFNFVDDLKSFPGLNSTSQTIQQLKQQQRHLKTLSPVSSPSLTRKSSSISNSASNSFNNGSPSITVSPSHSSSGLEPSLDSPESSRRSRSYTLIENALSDNYSRSYKNLLNLDNDQDQQQPSTNESD